jgi:hypothetical protein
MSLYFFHIIIIEKNNEKTKNISNIYKIKLNLIGNLFYLLDCSFTQDIINIKIVLYTSLHSFCKSIRMKF